MPQQPSSARPTLPNRKPDMPTTTPNPAELAAAEVKRLACNMAEAWSEYNQPHQSTAKFWDVYQTALKTMCAAINQLRDLASGPSAEAVAVGQIEEEPARSAPNAAGGYQTIPAKLYVKWSPVMPPVGTKLYAAPAATPPAEKEVRVPQAWGGIDVRGKLADCSLSRGDIEHAGLRAVPLGIQGEANEQ